MSKAFLTVVDGTLVAVSGEDVVGKFEPGETMDLRDTLSTFDELACSSSVDEHAWAREMVDTATVEPTPEQRVVETVFAVAKGAERVLRVGVLPADMVGWLARDAGPARAIEAQLRDLRDTMIRQLADGNYAALYLRLRSEQRALHAMDGIVKGEIRKAFGDYLAPWDGAVWAAIAALRALPNWLWTPLETWARDVKLAFTVEPRDGWTWLSWACGAGACAFKLSAMNGSAKLPETSVHVALAGPNAWVVHRHDVDGEAFGRIVARGAGRAAIEPTAKSYRAALETVAEGLLGLAPIAATDVNTMELCMRTPFGRADAEVVWNDSRWSVAFYEVSHSGTPRTIWANVAQIRPKTRRAHSELHYDAYRLRFDLDTGAVLEAQGLNTFGDASAAPFGAALARLFDVLPRIESERRRAPCAAGCTRVVEVTGATCAYCRKAGDREVQKAVDENRAGAR